MTSSSPGKNRRARTHGQQEHKMWQQPVGRKAGGKDSSQDVCALGALPHGESVLQKSREPHIYNQVSLGGLRW